MSSPQSAARNFAGPIGDQDNRLQIENFYILNV
jgi:hypothetical protein